MTSIGQQPRSPSPELEYLDEEMHTVSPRPPTPESLDNVEPENNNLDEDLLDGLQVEEDPNVPPEDEPSPPGDEEDETSPPSDEEDEPPITLERMQTNLQFVRMIEEATLESQFSPAELEAFRDPQELGLSPSDDRDLRLSISFFISGLDHNTSQRHYASECQNIMDAYPDLEMLSVTNVLRGSPDVPRGRARKLSPAGRLTINAVAHWPEP